MTESERAELLKALADGWPKDSEWACLEYGPEGSLVFENKAGTGQCFFLYLRGNPLEDAQATELMQLELERMGFAPGIMQRHDNRYHVVTGTSAEGWGVTRAEAVAKACAAVFDARRCSRPRKRRMKQ